jgi:hypothetical protein
MHDLLYAGAGGALLGSAFGALARNPAAADLAEATARTSKSLMQDIENSSIKGEASMGAAQASPRMAVRTDTYDWMGPPVEDAAPRSVMGSVRYDLSAQLGTSENTATRLLGAHLVEDAVGRANNLETPFAVSESARKIQRRVRGAPRCRRSSPTSKSGPTISISTGRSVSTRRGAVQAARHRRHAQPRPER